MKFIHAADIHLDSPLIGLEQYDGAPVEDIRGATRQALQNLVELAIVEHVAFLLVAGDLYDGDWKDYNTGLFFAAQMTKLREAGIRVFLIAGNHDAASQITRPLRMPDNVKWLSVQKPESIVMECCGVAIHGQGFSSRSVAEDISAAYPESIPGLFNIGLLHTSANGREGHESYAPCSLQGLLSKDYDYWALGHVHKREILHQNPWVLFPGNIQGRHVRETGPKGCTLVTVQDETVLVEHRDIDVLRWAVCDVDASDAVTGEEVLDRVAGVLKRELSGADNRPLAVRLRITGSCGAHGALSANTDRWTNEIRAIATDLSNGEIWIENIRLQTQNAVDIEGMARTDSPLGGLLRMIGDLDADEQVLASMIGEFADIQRKLPAELRTGEDAIDLDNPETLRGALEDVKQLLVARILSGDDGR